MSVYPPKMIASRGSLRLVHQQRDLISWPNVSDLTLERASDDAMGQRRWVYVTSWCLSPQSDTKTSHDTAVIALKMLLDTGEVEKP